MSEKPFLLFDDGRTGAGRLYRDPVEVIETRAPDKVPRCLERLARSGNLHAAGFLAYEAGLALEDRLRPRAHAVGPEQPPLLWFGLFEHVEPVDVPAWLPDPAGAWSGPARPLIEREAYETAVAAVQEHILAGDIYQANLTFPAELRTAGHPLALYASIRPRARAPHGGILFTGSHWLLSFSPELFFSLCEGRIVTRPMKGTAARSPSASPGEDDAAARALRQDPKQRAENLMIVDLLRNDLNRVARTGTVKVPQLFAVETYPTVHQMTSTVSAQLEEGLGAVDVLRTIFPCGSITGAPKIRAMEIIDEVEPSPRGPYTGSIGWVAPCGEAEFNVAIRTLVMGSGDGRAAIGLGSGIVADSRAGDEWRECLAKGAFVSDPDRSFDLVETMRFDPREGITELERHLGRMKRSAEALGFRFDRHHARNELQAATFGVTMLGKLRLLLSRSGAIAVEVRPLGPDPADPVEVALGALPVASDDFRLAHKTSDRGFYDEARRSSGAFEILFADVAGFLTEGSFTSLFVPRGGRLATPPLSRGLLPGILRERLLETGEAFEADLVKADLVKGFYVGNAVRGLMRATLRP